MSELKKTPKVYAAIATVAAAGALALVSCTGTASAESPMTSGLLASQGFVQFQQLPSDCTGVVSVTGVYNGESQMVVNLRRSEDGRDWIQQPETLEGVESRVDGEATYRTGKPFVRLSRAADRAVTPSGETVAQSFEIRWNVPLDDDAFYAVEVSVAEQEEGSWLLSLAPFHSESCSIY